MTLPSDIDKVQVWAVEVGATVRGSGEYMCGPAKRRLPKRRLDPLPARVDYSRVVNHE
jgi:hypothetical protein